MLQKTNIIPIKLIRMVQEMTASFSFVPAFVCTVQPVLRGHILDKEKVAYKTGDLLKEVQFI